MISRAKSSSVFMYFLPQNILMILLSVLICATFFWIICLSYPSVFIAKTESLLVDGHGNPIAEPERDNAAAILLSKSVYKELANRLVGEGIYLSEPDFYRSASIIAKKNSFSLSFTADNKRVAKDTVTHWVEIFRQRVLNVVANKQNLNLAEEQKRRDKAITAAASDFKASLKELFDTNSQNTTDTALYSKFFDAVNKRIAYETRIQALEEILQKQQSPLVLEFIAHDPAVSQLSDQLNKIKTQRAYLQSQLGEKHSQIKAVIAEEKAIDKALSDKIALTINQLYLNAQMAQTMQDSLYKELLGENTTEVSALDHAFANFERQLKKSWAEYDQTYLRQIIKPATVFFVQARPIQVEKSNLSKQLSYLIVFAFVLGLCIFWALVLFIEKSIISNRAANTKLSPYDQSQLNLDRDVSEQGVVATHKDKKQTFDDLIQSLEHSSAKRVIVAGHYAAQIAARIGIVFEKNKNKVLLIDISASQIGSLIGPHRGFTDVLTGDAAIQEVIYKDYDTGIDILPQGLASAMRARDFSKDIGQLVDTITEQYDIVLFTMSTPPSYGLNEIIKLCDCAVICALNNNEQTTWQTAFNTLDMPHTTPLYKVSF